MKPARVWARNYLISVTRNFAGKPNLAVKCRGAIAGTNILFNFAVQGAAFRGLIRMRKTPLPT